jgi:hypothetical protein
VEIFGVLLMDVLKFLYGRELDDLVRQGILESDLRFLIKRNAHKDGSRIFVKLDPDSHLGIIPYYDDSPENTFVGCLVRGDHRGITIYGRVDRDALMKWLEKNKIQISIERNS